MDVATLIPIETNRNIPELAPGDTVRVSVKVVEGTRERIQVFEGVVIRVRKGTVNANFTVRRIASHSVGVERTFFLHSPRVDKVEVVRHGVVRRAKLYYLRGRTGRAARLRERRVAPGKRAAQVAAAAAAAEAAAAEAAEAAEATLLRRPLLRRPRLQRPRLRRPRRRKKRKRSKRRLAKRPRKLRPLPLRRRLRSLRPPPPKKHLPTPRRTNRSRSYPAVRP